MPDRKVRPRARDGSPKGRDRISGLGSRQPGDRPKGRAGVESEMHHLQLARRANGLLQLKGQLPSR